MFSRSFQTWQARAYRSQVPRRRSTTFGKLLNLQVQTLPLSQSPLLWCLNLLSRAIVVGVVLEGGCKTCTVKVGMNAEG